MPQVLRKSRLKGYRLLNPETKCQGSMDNLVLKSLTFVLVVCLLFALGYSGDWETKSELATSAPEQR